MSLPAPPRPGYRLAFADEFDAPALDESRWVPFYSPHWSTPALATPRLSIAESCLILRIDEDQPAWCPEFDGDVKASLIQTGHFSGQVGSSIGQHRFKDGLIVRSALPEMRTYVPRYGYFELRARAEMGPANLVSLYTLGFEHSPDECGEITVMEIFSTGVGPSGTRLGHGIKPFRDPRLSLEFHDDPLPFDPADWHVYAADWTAEGVDFFLDGHLLHHTGQSPDYPMQFMLGIYELPGVTGAGPSPATFSIDWFRAWERE